MKKSITKKSISLLLMLTLLMSCAPLSFAASEYDAALATTFIFSDTGITAEDGKYTSYKISGTSLTIDGSGTYVLTGSCTDGNVTIKKNTKDVIIVLKNLNLASENTAPISCNKSTSVTILSAVGTENTLTDSTKNNDETNTDNEQAENAVIKCKDGSQVIICGLGTLNINANGKNGIKSGATTESEGEASLLIKDVTLNITAAVNDAINAEQLLTVESGKITITAADDAIHSDLALIIGTSDGEGPTIVVNDCYEGLEGANLSILSGNIKINSEDDCLNAANSDLTGYSFTLDISGGTLYMYSESGDGIDSNGTLTISGGSVVVWTANTADNQPLDADSTISITGGTVFAAGGSSGMGMRLNTTISYITFGSQNQGGFGGGQQPGNRPKDEENTNNKAMALPGFGNPGGSGTTLLTKGSAVSIKNSDGDSIYSDTAPCNSSYVFFASGLIDSEKTYTLYSGETSVSDTTSGESTCTCICHKSSAIFRLIWKILCFVYKAIGINRYCSCGVAHW